MPSIVWTVLGLTWLFIVVRIVVKLQSNQAELTELERANPWLKDRSKR